MLLQRLLNCRPLGKIENIGARLTETVVQRTSCWPRSRR